MEENNIHFILEEDAEDWAWLLAEKSPTLASLELKVENVALAS